MSQLFTYRSHKVRTITENHETWFVAKDVCEALGLKWHGKVLIGIPESWQSMRSHLTLRRGSQRIRFISEAAVYKLAFRSNKPEADAFTNWVASDVLPTIRHTGAYNACTGQSRMSDRDKELWPETSLPVPSISQTEKCLETMIHMLEKTGRVMDFESETMRAYHSENRLGPDLCLASCCQIEAASEALKLAKNNLQAALFIKKASDKAAALWKG